MKVLFIGGTGVISSACSNLALERGIDLSLLNRGQSHRPTPDGARVITADIRDPDSVRTALGDERFDVIVDWIAFTPDHIETDLALFRNRTAQFIFISSASAYQTPPARLPVTEETPLANPFWRYSQEKIACEERLMSAHQSEGFPVTIVRPSHTYDRTMVPLSGRYTPIARMKAGKPIIIHGDGSSLWTLTHNTDFARGFIGLLGHEKAIGQAFHITADFFQTWDQIALELAAAAAVEAHIIHVPSDTIAAYDQKHGEGLLGDKAHSMIFDNSKVKSLVPDFECRIPFSQGAREIIAWFDDDPARQQIDEHYDVLCDRIIEAQRSALP
ncbi:MAG: NAD-dependent dehydratase [Verrucomicrobia bacterium]|nr:MAG: NAD-dependent dehydratase [Verrucomicrobiota bacterium]